MRISGVEEVVFEISEAREELIRVGLRTHAHWHGIGTQSALFELPSLGVAASRAPTLHRRKCHPFQHQ